jgi:Importin repeat
MPARSCAPPSGARWSSVRFAAAGRCARYLLQVASAEKLEESTRQLAAEFLVTLCEAREKAPGMMRKLPQFVDSLFQTLMLFLLDIEVRGPPGCVTLHA